MANRSNIIGDWPWKLILRTKSPTQVCFSWLAAQGARLTQEVIRVKGIVLCSRCFMCKEDGEDIDHLIVHCIVARTLWNLLNSIFGTSWVMPRSLKEVFVIWNGFKVRKSTRDIWKMIPRWILWSIWKERNQRCFEGISTSIHTLKCRCFLNLFAWGNFSDLLYFVSSRSRSIQKESQGDVLCRSYIMLLSITSPG